MNQEEEDLDRNRMDSITWKIVKSKGKAKETIGILLQAFCNSVVASCGAGVTVREIPALIVKECGNIDWDGFVRECAHILDPDFSSSKGCTTSLSRRLSEMRKPLKNLKEAGKADEWTSSQINRQGTKQNPIVRQLLAQDVPKDIIVEFGRTLFDLAKFLNAKGADVKVRTRKGGRSVGNTGGSVPRSPQDSDGSSAASAEVPHETRSSPFDASSDAPRRAPAVIHPSDLDGDGTTDSPAIASDEPPARDEARGANRGEAPPRAPFVEPREGAGWTPYPFTADAPTSPGGPLSDSDRPPPFSDPSGPLGASESDSERLSGQSSREDEAAVGLGAGSPLPESPGRFSDVDLGDEGWGLGALDAERPPSRAPSRGGARAPETLVPDPSPPADAGPPSPPGALALPPPPAAAAGDIQAAGADNGQGERVRALLAEVLAAQMALPGPEPPRPAPAGARAAEPARQPLPVEVMGLVLARLTRGEARPMYSAGLELYRAFGNPRVPHQRDGFLMVDGRFDEPLLAAASPFLDAGRAARDIDAATRPVARLAGGAAARGLEPSGGALDFEDALRAGPEAPPPPPAKRARGRAGPEDSDGAAGAGAGC